MMNTIKSKDISHRYAVIVAGGSGTRLWPLSRRSLPKQMQKFISDRTLIDETVERLRGTIPTENIYISTTGNYAAKIKELLPHIPAENIIIEPAAQGTVGAFALFTSTIYRRDPDAFIYSLASDHAVTGSEEFHETIRGAFEFIEKNTSYIGLVGIKPDKPDTGLGYVKVKDKLQKDPLIYTVEKFVEKPGLEVAQTYLESNEYFWNAAYYCFRASTLLDAYNDADPEILRHINQFIDEGDVKSYMSLPIKAHEIEFIDSSKFPLALIPGDFKWSDIGNWQALHRLLAEFDGTDMVHQGSSERQIDINSADCLVFSTDTRLIATIGLNNVVIVSTDDVLLVLNKDQPGDIKELLSSIKSKGFNQYL